MLLVFILLHKASYNGVTILNLMLDDIQTLKKYFQWLLIRCLQDATGLYSPLIGWQYVGCVGLLEPLVLLQPGRPRHFLRRQECQESFERSCCGNIGDFIEL